MPPERRSWSVFADEWDPDHDPALLRMRDALALGRVAAPGPPESPEVAAEDAAPEIAVPDEVEALTTRLRSGDLSVRERLRRLIGR